MESNVEARYKQGDRVRVRVDDPPGHYRTPGYVQGKTGTVERAPLLGEHNLQVYGSLGYSAQDVVALARAGAV